ncbi:MAG: hypothetical protein K6F53_02165 [Lachnospiraceae bacterium]|nr:hypothetical protein [Lachnospiraceae bacterium]
MNGKIYFDMDGVLADFERGVEELCGIPLPEQGLKRSSMEDSLMWEKIREVPHFYDRLEPMPGALEFFHTIHDRFGDNCEILTGIPKPKRGIKDAGKDKEIWAHRVLSKDLKVNIVFREEKKNFCRGREDILIDDLLPNIEVWEAFGGTGILFRNPEDALKELREILKKSGQEL